MWTCNRLNLQTQGSQPIMPENLPDHWAGLCAHNMITNLNSIVDIIGGGGEGGKYDHLMSMRIFIPVMN